MLQGLRSCGRSWRRVTRVCEGSRLHKRSTLPLWSELSPDTRTEGKLPGFYKKGAGLLTMAAGLELARGTKMTEQIEKIKTRQHHPCFSEFKHTLLRMKPPMMGRKQDR